MTKFKLAFSSALSISLLAASPYANSKSGIYLDQSKKMENKIDYVFVLMLENRSFDTYFGKLPDYLKRKNSSDRRAKLFDGTLNGGIDVPDEQDHCNSDKSSINHCWKYHSDSEQAKKQIGGGLCVSDTAHDWWGAHLQWNNGKMDGFAKSNDGYYEGGEPKVSKNLLSGERAMLYYDERDIPFFYWLADNFAIGDRYFSSVLGPTWVNRDYLYGATSQGLTSNFTDSFDSSPTLASLPVNCSTTDIADALLANKTTSLDCNKGNITELLEKNNLSVAYWLRDLSGTPANSGFTVVPKIGSWTGASALTDSHVRSFDKGTYSLNGTVIKDEGFEKELDKEAKSLNDFNLPHSHLSAVNFIDPQIQEDVNGEDDHPPATPINGQKLVYQVVKALMKNPEIWERSVLFITYDEHGGFYDHVAPPPVIAPDDIKPKWSGPYGNSDNAGTNKGIDESYGGGFNRYGIRVPFIVVSPWVKKRYVSHKNYDHTSILRFIEERWNLPYLTRRDLMSASISENMFDFTTLVESPSLPSSNELKSVAASRYKIIKNTATKEKFLAKNFVIKNWANATPTNPKGFIPPICRSFFLPKERAEGSVSFDLGQNTYGLKDWSQGLYPPTGYDPKY